MFLVLVFAWRECEKSGAEPKDRRSFPVFGVGLFVQVVYLLCFLLLSCSDAKAPCYLRASDLLQC